MRGFYSSRSPRIWRGERLHREPEGPTVDPYGKERPGYRERTRQTETQIAPGMTRVDIGEPIVRTRGEPQPVDLAPPAEVLEEPEGFPEVTEVAAPDIQSILRSTSLPEYKPGLGRG